VTVTQSLTLYSTDGCHLCERAQRLLRSMPELRRTTLDVVDIADDEVLFERYGLTIPVLVAGPRELTWPFNADDVLELLN
jgi:glutaredoxin